MWRTTMQRLPQRLRRPSVVVALGSSTVIVAVSLYVRTEQARRLETLALARDQMTSDELQEAMANATRTGLMGTSLPGAKSVKEELGVIRTWHQNHGYKGGIVLRELTKPLFRLYQIQKEDEAAEEDAQDDLPLFDLTDPLRLARRECYYLYYELTDTGQLRQQIFCRGTTLMVDLLTCLQTWWKYDDDLGCYVHAGFCNHADRMLRDILPLLSQTERSTIEVTGHSLGGAVAMILAVKLQRRGYNVVGVTAIAAPRFCGGEAAVQLRSRLPPKTLRIEHDRDAVPWLPPFMTPVGNKLWLVSHGPARFICANDEATAWTESAFWNLRLPETLKSFGSSHRIRSHVSRIKQILNDLA